MRLTQCILANSAVQKGRGEGTEGDVVLAVWKVMRNRIAVLASTLTVESGAAFVQGVMAGDAKFRALQQDASMLLQFEGLEATGSRHANERDAKSISHDLVPPRLIDWKRPSNCEQNATNALPGITTKLGTVFALYGSSVLRCVGGLTLCTSPCTNVAHFFSMYIGCL